MKVVHLTFKEGEIFLDDPKGKARSYKRGIIDDSTSFNKEIMSKHIMHNVLLTLLGEIPIPSLRDSIFTTVLKDIDDEVYCKTRKVIERSYYKINQFNHTHDYNNNNNKDNTFYYIQQRLGRKKGISERNVSETVNNNSKEIKGYISWERIKNECDKETFDKICDLLYEIVSFNPLSIPLKEMINLLSSYDCKEIIYGFIEENAEISNNLRLIRLLTNIANKSYATNEFVSHPQDKGRGLPYDIRLNIGKKTLLQTTEIKYSLLVDGELLLLMDDDLFELMRKNYAPSKIFDGGVVKIEGIIDENTISIEEIKNDGFKPLNNLNC